MVVNIDRLGNIFFLNKKKYIQFDKKDDEVYNIAKPICYQELIPIKMQFQVESFYKTSIFFLVW